MQDPSVPWPAPADVRGVLYDLDGVLIDSGRAWHRVIGRLCQELGYADVSYEAFRRTFGQGVEADQQEFFPRHPVTAISELYDRYFPEELEAVELMDGALEVLARVRAFGVRQAVVTNTPRALAVRILAHKGITPLLEATAAAGDAPDKPAPDLVLLAVERLALQRSQVIYVGDSKTDLAAARSAGVAIAGLRMQADLMLQTLDELLPLVGAEGR